MAVAGQQDQRYQRRIGAAQRNVTPEDTQFLFGYPLVERMSTGIHDPLWATAFYLDDGVCQAMFIAVDVIFLSKQQVCEARQLIMDATGMPAGQVMITATHTHSGPVTIQMTSNADDAVVPKPDPTYLRKLIQGIVAAGCDAFRNAVSAEIGLVVPRVIGLGTNRHDPKGPSIPEVPILAARSLHDQHLIGVMCVCAMHPTVLHEDSTLITGDFPGLARQELQARFYDIPIVYHMGAAGNQSPRHVTRSNTFEEAKRLGSVLALSVATALAKVSFLSDWSISCETADLELPVRFLPSLENAEASLREAESRLELLRSSGPHHPAVRTAECDLFGAQETVTLARAQQDGRLQETIHACLPAEIQLITVGPWRFVGWPCGVFVEFALDVQQQYPNAHVITLANGELQGYLVTEKAVREKTYESSNAVFASPDSGELLVKQTIELLKGSYSCAVD